MKSLDDLEKIFEKGMTEWQDRIFVQEAQKIGLRACGEVKRLTPVDTGTLRRRWTAKVSQEGGSVVIFITNNTHYGPAVNYGHRIVRGGKTVGKTRGVHMLENGLYYYKRNLIQGDIQAMLQRLREVF